MIKKFSLVLLLLVLGLISYNFLARNNSGTANHVRPITNQTQTIEQAGFGNQETKDSEKGELTAETNRIDSSPNKSFIVAKSTRQQFVADTVVLPLSGSTPTENVKHSIPIEEIRQGCFRQDCIPSVDNPQFMTTAEAVENLPTDTIGIALSYQGIDRFYPFNMLVTREIVNDTIAGEPVLVTYCPLCGTGIVFERRVNGVVQEFGVSGMLWQSNLLMYNRAASVDDRNLWSQVLGEAVVGNNTGEKLSIIPSDIMRLTDWAATNPAGEVLNTGSVGDPYGGNYYAVARNFRPNFNEANSPLDPSAYVYGIEVNGTFKAYPQASLPTGETKDVVSGIPLTIINDSKTVTFKAENGEIIPDVEGFWFSWVAAHPETLLWSN